MERQIFLCEDSPDGIFSGVYDAWASGFSHDTVELCTKEPESPEFFCVYHHLEPDAKKAEKVLRTLKRRFGEEYAEWILYAAVSWQADKGTAVFRTISAGIRSRMTLENQKDEWIRKVAQYRRNVWNEHHHYLGFVRFREVRGGILFGKIAPKNQVLPLMAEHFQNRLPGERWILLDERHNAALFHERGEACVLIYGLKEQILRFPMEECQSEYEELWRVFCRSIAIDERKNKRLQNQMLPLRFRENMVEFNKNIFK